MFSFSPARSDIVRRMIIAFLRCDSKLCCIISMSYLLSSLHTIYTHKKDFGNSSLNFEHLWSIQLPFCGLHVFSFMKYLNISVLVMLLYFTELKCPKVLKLMVWKKNSAGQTQNKIGHPTEIRIRDDRTRIKEYLMHQISLNTILPITMHQ